MHKLANQNFQEIWSRECECLRERELTPETESIGDPIINLKVQQKIHVCDFISPSITTVQEMTNG